MDGIVIATLVFSGCAALFSVIGVWIAVNNQGISKRTAERLERKNDQWTPLSPPQ